MQELTDDALGRSRGRFPEIEITGHWLLGQLRLANGDLDGATKLTRQSAEMAHSIGWAWWELASRVEVAGSERQSGQLHELLM